MDPATMASPNPITRAGRRLVNLLRHHAVPVVALSGLITSGLPLLPIGNAAQQEIIQFYQSLPLPVPNSNSCLIISAICLAYWATHDLKPAVADLWEIASTIMFKFRLKPSVVERYTREARAESRAQGRHEGRHERQAEIAERLKARGYDLNELLSETDDSEPNTAEPKTPA